MASHAVPRSVFIVFMLLAFGHGISPVRALGLVIAVDDSFEIEAERTAHLDVLANDTGADLALIGVEVEGDDVPVSAYLGDGHVVVVPEDRFTGRATLRYSVSAGATQASATVTVTVAAAATTDWIFTTVGVPLTIDPLANDRGAATLAEVEPPGSGETEMLEDGRVRFTPDAPGVDGFVYRAVDGTGVEREGRVEVRVRDTDGALEVPAIAVDLRDTPDPRVDRTPRVIALGSLPAPVVAVRDGSHGVATVAGPNAIAYRSTRLGRRTDHVVVFVAGEDGSWGRGVITVRGFPRDLRLRMGFEAAPELGDDLGSGTPVSYLDSGSPRPAPMASPGLAAVGDRALDLRGAENGLVHARSGVEAGSGSFSAWVRFPDGLAEHAMTLVAAGTANAGTAITHWSLAVEPEGPERGRLVLRDEGQALASADLIWDPSTWYHVASTWSDSGRRLYLDGTLVAEIAEDDPFGAPPAENASDIAIGNRLECLETACDGSLAGLLDQVRIFATALDREAVVDEVAAEHPAVTLDLAMGVAGALGVGNRRDHDAVLTLEQRQGSPAKVLADDGSVGLAFESAGGALVYKPSNGVAWSPESGFVHLAVQGPEDGFESDLVLFEDPEDQVRLVLRPAGPEHASIVLWRDGAPVLGADDVALAAGTPFEVTYLWGDGEQSIRVDGAVLSVSSYDPRPAPGVLTVPLGPAASLWGLLIGGGVADMPAWLPGRIVPVVAVWIPDDGLGNLLQLRGDQVVTRGAPSCRSPGPWEPKCSTPGQLLVPRRREHLRKVLAAGKIPTNREVYWWNRRTRRLDHLLSVSFDLTLIFDGIATSQLVGTGGSRKVPHTNRSWGIGQATWTGTTSQGKASGLDCNFWSWRSPWKQGTTALPEATDVRWLDAKRNLAGALLWRACAHPKPVRCACNTKRKKPRPRRKPLVKPGWSGIFEDGFEVGGLDLWR